MKRLSVHFRLGFIVALFFLTFAGSPSDLEEYRKSFFMSRHPRPELTGFEGIRFGMTLEEFRQMVEENPSLDFPGNATVDWGRKGGRRMKVYMKEKGYAGAIQGNYYLFRLDSSDHGTVLGNAFFTPGEQRLHHLTILFPDTLYSDMEIIEKDVRNLYAFYGKQLGVEDYASGRNDGDWGPQIKKELTRKNLNHPRVGKGSDPKVFSAWFHPQSEWKVLILGNHFQHDKNRYQVILDLSLNVTRDF